MISETKSSQINLRLQPALKEAAEKAAVQDHRSLTSLIEKLLADYLKTQPTLEDWHERVAVRFADILSEKKVPGDLNKKCRILSYSIITSGGERLNPASLTRKLQAIHQGQGSLISTPNLFYPYTRPEIAPYFTSDSRLKRGSADEILECGIFPDTAVLQGSTGLWRVSPSGLATHVRPHFEDLDEFRKYGLEPGKWFCPFFMTRDLAELVFHAQSFSREFPSAQTIEFRCEFSGLLEREIGDARPLVSWLPGKIARVDHRITTWECPAGDYLRAGWPEVVSALGAPVMRLFDPVFDYSSDWVREQSQWFRN